MSKAGLRLPAVVVLAALAALARPAAGQGRELLEPHDGALARYGMTGRWLELPVAAYNYDETARQVLIACETIGADGGGVRFTRLLDLPPNTRRDTLLACQIGRLRPAGTKVRESPVAELTFSSYDARTGQLLDRRGKNLLCLDAGQKLVGFWQVLAAENDAYEYLTRPGATAIANLAPTVGSVRELPDRWYGYDTAHICMVGPLASADLRQSQLSALLEWVRRGGTLVLAGNARMPEYLHGELARAAGATAVGAHNFMELTVSGPALKAPVTAKFASPLPMAELCPAGAEVLCQADGLPLILLHRLGEGQVFTMATPLGALAEARLQELTRLFDVAAATRCAIDGNLFFEPAKETLADIAGPRGPRPIVPLTVLGVLLLVALAAGAALRARRRGELAWLVLAPLAVLAAVGFYVAGKLSGNPEHLTGVGLVTGLGDGLARVQGSLAYYSGPAGRKISPSVRNGVIKDVGGGAAVLAPVEIRTDGNLSMPDRAVHGRETVGLYVDRIRPMPSPAMKLTFGPGGLTGTIANPLGQDIVNAVLYANRRGYRLGDLPCEAKTPVEAGAAQRLGEGEFTGGLIQDALANGLIRRLRPAPDIFRPVRRDPLLIGQIKSCPLDVLPGETMDRRGWSVAVFPIALEAPPPGTRVLLPAGFVDMEYRRQSMTVWNPLREEFAPQNADAEILLAVRPPGCVARLEKASARIQAVLQAVSCRLTVAGMPGDVEVGRFDNPAGPITVTVPDADRFRDASGAYLFKLSVARIGARKNDLDATGAPWTFNSLDVELEGTVK